MNGKFPWQCGALVGAIALIVGCSPDTPERGAANQSRAEEGALSRNDAQAPRDNGGAIRPPTTTPSPAEPGAPAAATPPAATPPAATPRLMARADVRPLGDNTARGIVEIQTAADGDGPLTIHVLLMGLDAGPHGMHIHLGTDCAAPGLHLNPLNSPHGAANAGATARHLGDLGNVTADASGMVDEMLRDPLLATDMSFFGKVVVVHEGQDDLSTQPGGDAGEPIACGVIERAEDVISRAPEQDRGV